MSWDFDYAKAWRKLVKPLYEELSDEDKTFISHAMEAVHESSQDKNTLLIPWPEDGALKEQFASMAAAHPAHLARMSRIVYSYGHWKPGKEEGLDTAGGHWKFASLADQALREAAGLPIATNGRSDYRGWSFQIHEGLLRAQHSGAHHWMWEEVALGTPDAVKAVRSWCMGKPVDILSHKTDLEQIYDRAPIPADMKPFLDMKGAGYYTHKKDTDLCDDELQYKYGKRVAPLCRVLSVMRINWRYANPDRAPSMAAHPYTIGSKHLQGDSMYVNTEIGCAYKEPGRSSCGLPASEHVCDKALAIQLTRNCTAEEFEACMKPLQKDLEADNIDGFAMIETPEKYRIENNTDNQSDDASEGA